MELSSVIRSCHGVDQVLSGSCPLPSGVVIELTRCCLSCPQPSGVVMKLTMSCHGVVLLLSRVVMG